MTILVSPAEPKALYTVGEVSSLPETMGADFLTLTGQGWVGIQRKEVRDLVASIRGDRIARELGQSTSLHRMVLIVEGDWDWSRTGESRRVPGFLRAQLDGFLLSVQHHGWWHLTSVSVADTARQVPQIASWFAKGSHASLAHRPKSRALWGTHANREWAVHLYQSFDGIGVEMAGRLYDQLGVPLRWTITEADLLAVPGIGPGRARKILEALPQVDTDAMVGT